MRYICTSIVATLVLCTPVCAGWSMEEIWITNPTSGVELHANIIYPDAYDPSAPDGLYPGIVLVPGGSAPGGGFFATGHAQALAESGVVTMFFDPDGRGQSTNNVRGFDAATGSQIGAIEPPRDLIQTRGSRHNSTER